MRFLLTLLAMFLIITGILIGCSLAIGFLMHWLVPGIDLGISTLIGIIAVSVSLHLVGRVLTVAERYREPDADLAPDSLPTAYFIEPLTPRRKRQRKRP